MNREDARGTSALSAALSAENRLLRDSVWRVQNALSEAQAEHVKLAQQFRGASWAFTGVGDGTFQALCWKWLLVRWTFAVR